CCPRDGPCPRDCIVPSPSTRDTADAAAPHCLILMRKSRRPGWSRGADTPHPLVTECSSQAADGGGVRTVYRSISRGYGFPRGSAVHGLALALAEPLQGESDQPVHKLGNRHAAGFPKHGVHADRSEAGQRVHLIEENPVGATLDEADRKSAE